MKRTAILASVFAFVMSFVASAADDWFNGGIDSGWTNSTDMAGGLWSASDGSDVMGLAAWDGTAEALVVDTDEDQQMLFTATTAKDLGTSTESVTINSTIKFNAFKEDAMPAVPQEAKAGLIVVKDGSGNYDYYGLVADGDPASNIWAKLTYSGTIDIAAAADVVVQMSKSGDQTLVTYTVGGVALGYGSVGSSIPVVASGSVSIAAYSGSGEVSALSATATMKTVDLDIDRDSLASSNLVVRAVYNITDPSVTNQIEIAEQAVPVAYGTKILVEYAGAQGWALAGGTVTREYTLTTDFTIDENVGDLPVPTAAPFMLIIADGATTNFYATIQEAVVAAYGNEEASITLCNDYTGAGAYLWDKSVTGGAMAITLNLDGYTYTLDKGAEFKDGAKPVDYKVYGFAVRNDNSLVISNGTITVAEDAPVAEFLRTYTTNGVVTVENVTLDGANLTDQGDDDPAQGIYNLGARVYLTGSTTVTVPDGKFALVLGKHSAGYAEAANLIEVGGGVTINGNVFLAGGGYTEDGSCIVESCEYYYGTMEQSKFSAVDSESFVAAVGTNSIAALTAGTRMVAGRLYKEIAEAEAAFADAEAGATLGLLGAYTVDTALEVSAGKRVEVDGVGTLTVPAEATLTVNGELQLAPAEISECAFEVVEGADVVLGAAAVLTSSKDDGADMSMLGTMTITAGATVDLGATAWIGASGKFNVTAGTLVQTPNEGSGNCYTLAANATMTMTGDFPETDDVYELNLNSAITATDATKATALEKIVPTADYAEGYEVVENSGVYTLAAKGGGDTPVPEPAEDTPTACSNALVTAGFDANSDVVKKITNKAQIGSFNTFLAKHSIGSVSEDMTAGQKQFAYDSYVLDSVLTDGVLFSTQPVLKASAVTIDGTNLSLAINLSAAGVDAADIKLIADKIADCIRTGSSLTSIASWTKPTVSASTGDGTATVTFTIEKSGNINFYRSVVADPAANEE